MTPHQHNDIVVLMIPSVDLSTGYLPPGVHSAVWKEIPTYFAGNSHRAQLVAGLEQALRNFAGAGCRTVLLDGSFISIKVLPQDYDAAWAPYGVDPSLLDPVLLDFSKKRAAMKLKYGGEFFPASAFAVSGRSLSRLLSERSKWRSQRHTANRPRKPAMISNERQYRITKSEAEKFRQALADLEKGPAQEGVHPRLVQAQREAMQSQLEELNDEIAEYERLKSGNVPAIQIQSFDELADGLIKARIAAGLSQKELAERLGLKEQQIQRYEADRYSSASFQRLQQVARAIGVEVRKEILLPLVPTNFNSLVAKLNQAGIDSEFLRTKLLPTADAAVLDGSLGASDESALIASTTNIANRIFGWSQDELFAAAPLAPPRYAAAAARFKIPAGRGQRAATLYAAYANYLAVVVLNACGALPRHPIPADAVTFRNGIISRYGVLSLKSVLYFAWDLGVPVLPLRDPGRFHGACWRYDHRNVVVLKQNSRHLARWLFDLLHEMFHAAQNPDRPTLEIVEADATSQERRTSDEEIAASQFAGDIQLNGQAEEIAQACVQQARGSVERLKSVVPDVAKQFSVDVGALSNYLAFRLSWQHINWWGAAANLQREDDHPWQIACDVFLERFPFNIKNELDHQLLSRALQ